MKAATSRSSSDSTSGRNYPPNPAGLPDPIHTGDEFELCYARSLSELESIQRLRYEVFNLELNEGLEASNRTGRDADVYDPYYHHLYVRSIDSGLVVGTYRMQTYEMSVDGIGLYSETEYDFSAMPDAILHRSVELGRACILKNFRSLKVLYLLWKGLGRYVHFNDKSYVFGCCSLTSQDENEGAAVYRYLRNNGHMHPDFRIRARPSHQCRTEPVAANDGFGGVRPPRLMRAYLSLGARICSPPAIDRQFKTIDFLALFGLDSLHESDLAFYKIR